MLRRLTMALAIPLFVAACGGGPPPEPPAPPPLDPTGTWDMLVDAGGTSLDVLLMISGSAESGYSGSVDSEMGGAGISSITVEGQTLTFEIPDISGFVSVTIEGNEFYGSLSSMMGEGAISGVKRPG